MRGTRAAQRRAPDPGGGGTARRAAGRRGDATVHGARLRRDLDRRGGASRRREQADALCPLPRQARPVRGGAGGADPGLAGAALGRGGGARSDGRGAERGTGPGRTEPDPLGPGAGPGRRGAQPLHRRAGPAFSRPRAAGLRGGLAARRAGGGAPARRAGEQGQIAVEDPEIAADLFLNLVLGKTSRQALYGIAIDPEAQETRRRAALALFLAGVRPRAT